MKGNVVMKSNVLEKSLVQMGKDPDMQMDGVPAVRQSEVLPENITAFTGIVTGECEPGTYQILYNSVTVRAKATFSLLLKPSPGDVVSCHISDNKKCYITDILEGSAEIESRTVVLPHRVSLLSSGELSLLAGQLVLKAVNLEQQSDMLLQTARTAEFHSERKIDESEISEELVRIKSFIAEQSREKVSGSCTSHLGSLSQNIDGCLSSHSQAIQLTAQNRVDIDGEKINLG